MSLIPVAEAETREAELDAADAIIFGSPTYMGGVSAEFAKFKYGSVWVGPGLPGGFQPLQGPDQGSQPGIAAPDFRTINVLSQAHR